MSILHCPNDRTILDHGRDSSLNRSFLESRMENCIQTTSNRTKSDNSTSSSSISISNDVSSNSSNIIGVVYSDNVDVSMKMDDLCYPGTMMDVASPLVIVGGTGTGKTALIANWVKKREVDQKTR